MPRTAAPWIALFAGLVLALVVNGQHCGSWGLDCFFYAYFIALATAALCAVLFWRALGPCTKGTAGWYLTAGMAALATLATAAGVVPVLLVLAR